MRRIHLGKIHPVLAIVIVLATLAVSAGGGILYQYFQGNKLSWFSEPEVEEEPVDDGSPRRMSIPPLGSGVASNTRPERTKPFKYAYSDIASTRSESAAAASSPAYSSTVLSAEEFEKGYRGFMLQAVEHFRTANADKDADLVNQAATLLAEVVNAGTDGDLTKLHERMEPMMLDQTIARDPIFQYVVGMVLAQNNDAKAASLWFNGSIVDHQKWDYPSRYAVLSFNERLRNGLDLKTNPDGYERHADALVGWLQYDFSATPDEQCFCWEILGDSIELLAKNEKLDHIKKIIDKNSEKNFVSPWLTEMMLAHYHLKLAMADDDTKENLNQSKQHLEAAIKINPAFTVAKTDLDFVKGRLADPNVE